jgi:hypothetical protein
MFEAAVPRAVRIMETREGKVAAEILLGLKASVEDDLANRPSHHDGEEDHDHEDFDSFALPMGAIADPSAFIAQLQSIANARFTFFAAELSPTVLDTGFATNVSLLRQPLPTGITLDFYSQLIAKQVQEKFELTAPVALAPGSLPAGKLVALSYKMRGANGELAVTTYLIMQAQTVYDLTFTTTSAQAESYASTFALIAKSFRLLEQ